MSVYQPKGSPFFQYDFQLGGCRFHGSTKETTRREAKRVEDAEKAARKAELVSGSFKHAVSLNHACGHYYEQVAKHQPSAETADYQLENLIRIIGNIPLHEIDDGKLADFVAHRRGEPHGSYKNPRTAPRVSPSTVNRETELLKRVLRRAAKVLKAKVADIEWADHILAEPEAPDRPLTEDQEERLFSELVPHAVPIVTAALILGVRKTAVVRLDWKQVDMKGREISFMLKSKKPGGRPHVMPINGELLALLANQRPEDSGPVFTYGPPCDCTFCKHERNHGRPIKSIRTAWESARERAGISEFRFHDLRHTVGSRILALTGDLVAAKEFLGHADISTTLRYMHHDKGHKLTVMDTPSESRNTPEVKECQETK